MISIYVTATIVYIIGIIGYIHTETIDDVRFHEGGFLGMGYHTCLHRAITTKDARKGLLWPILLIFWFIKGIAWSLNDLVASILLIFNYKYKETKVYKFIDDVLYRNI